uniref:Sushi domain-containing protein n=1 Tax=Ciona intestinalis TaxID=7719 RepID=H2XLE5_CIOIN
YLHYFYNFLYYFYIACPAPPAIKAPSLPQDTQVYPINSTYTYTCNNSNLVGNAINICTLGGWAYPAPQCLQVCYAPPVATNGSYSLLSSYYVVGGSVTYTCNAGFLLVGSIRNTCLNNLTWSSAAPECQPVCYSPPPINGEGNITPGKRYYNINDTVSYTCVHGNLFGNSSNQCVSANKWRNAAPTCWLSTSIMLFLLTSGTVSWLARPPVTHK